MFPKATGYLQLSQNSHCFHTLSLQASALEVAPNTDLFLLTYTCSFSVAHFKRIFLNNHKNIIIGEATLKETEFCILYYQVKWV